MIRSPECEPHCMQGELVGMPEYSCATKCEILLVRAREQDREPFERALSQHQDGSDAKKPRPG